MTDPAKGISISRSRFVMLLLACVGAMLAMGAIMPSLGGAATISNLAKDGSVSPQGLTPLVETGSIKVEVLNTAGKPIPDITFGVYSFDSVSNTYQYVASLQTDAGGVAKITAIPTGTYVVSFADAKGVYQTQYYNNAATRDTATKILVRDDHLRINGKTFYKITARMKGTNETINPAGVKLSLWDYEYTGSPRVPNLKNTGEINVTYNGVQLVRDLDYTTITATNNVNPGKATATVTLSGLFSGTVGTTFKIVPAQAKLSKIASPKTKQLKVTWKKDSKATGYQVRISLNKSFKNKSKAKVITKNKTTSFLFKGLKAKKTYYVQVRSYKIIDGAKEYGSWSYPTKKIKIK